MVSGLVLLAYVAMHLMNLASGLHSIAAMESARYWLQRPWTSSVGTVVLTAAVLVHGGLGLAAVATRRSLVLSRTDWVQTVLGLITTPLLLNHVFLLGVSRLIDAQFKPDYGLVLSMYWKFAPAYALQQVLLVVVVWIHGAIGLHGWLVLKPAWARIGALVTPLLFAAPIAALLGFVSSGREALARNASDKGWQDQMNAGVERAISASSALGTTQNLVLLVYGGLVLTAFGVYAWRVTRLRARLATVRYDGGLTASGWQGLSILEMSRLNRIPHAGICGGRARCGTCVVAVNHSPEALTPIGERERQTLQRIRAKEGQRLACQARLCGTEVDVVRLRPAYADAAAARDPTAWPDSSIAP